MGLFSVFGKIGKALGKGALAVGKVGLGVAASYVGISLPGSSTNGAASADASGGSTNTYTPGSAAQSSTPSLPDQLRGLLAVASGNKPIQVDAVSSSMPTWLLPVGILGLLGIGAAAVMKPKGRR